MGREYDSEEKKVRLGPYNVIFHNFISAWYKNIQGGP